MDEGFPLQLAETAQRLWNNRHGIVVMTMVTQIHVPQTAAARAQGSPGRPLVALNINGHTLKCFLDNGSEAIPIKPSTLQRNDPEYELHYRKCCREIQGVTGYSCYPQAEVFLQFYFNNQTLNQCTLVVDLGCPNWSGFPQEGKVYTVLWCRPFKWHTHIG